MNTELPSPSIYELLPPAGRRLARIPRFGRLIAMMRSKQFARLTSQPATLWELYTYVEEEVVASQSIETTGLLDSGLQATGASLLGWRKVTPPEPQPDRSEIAIRKWQRDLALTIISAIAFEMFCGQDGRGTTEPIYVAEGDIKALLNRAFHRVWNAGAYVDECGDPITPKKNLWNEWHRIKQMNAEGLRYLLMSDVGPDEDSEGNGERILFTDISTQAFFAAHWAARWADEADREMMLKWFPDPLLDTNEEYLEFWRMTAELPDAAIDLARWQSLFSPLYDGRLVDSQTRLVIRCTELIYHTWNRLQGSVARTQFEGEFDQLRKQAAGERKDVIQRMLLAEDGSSNWLSLCQGERGELDTGTFMMGAPVDEYPEWDSYGGHQNNPRHEVQLSHFRLHRFCVTNAEFELFDERHQAKRECEQTASDTDRHPVVNVRWYDAWCFAKWLGQIEVGNKTYELSLPTEAQWEYACRCGASTPFSWGGELSGDKIESEYCNFDGGYPWQLAGTPTGQTGVDRNKTVAVDGSDADGHFLPNAWGFSQMHGNVWEWCWDWYDEAYYDFAPQENPTGPRLAIYRVLRGGSWIYSGRGCRSGSRYGSTPGFRSGSFGFRLVAVPVEPSRSGSERSRRLGDR